MSRERHPEGSADKHGSPPKRAQNARFGGVFQRSKRKPRLEGDIVNSSRVTPFSKRESSKEGLERGWSRTAGPKGQVGRGTTRSDSARMFRRWVTSLGHTRRGNTELVNADRGDGLARGRIERSLTCPCVFRIVLQISDLAVVVSRSTHSHRLRRSIGACRQRLEVSPTGFIEHRGSAP